MSVALKPNAAEIAKQATTAVQSVLAFVDARIAQGRTPDQARKELEQVLGLLEHADDDSNRDELFRHVCRDAGATPAEADAVLVAVNAAIAGPPRKITGRDIRHVWPAMPPVARQALLLVVQNKVTRRPHSP